jgi:hypothetical protein
MVRIDPAALAQVVGGNQLTQAAKTVYDGGKYAVQATNNFVNGFAGGALHGPNASEDQMARFGDRNAPGFGAGVETGMMANMAMGPVGGILATASGSLPSGSSAR